MPLISAPDGIVNPNPVRVNKFDGRTNMGD
jgi:hypothetical protein